MSQPKLAPHDADLVEADARQLFEETCAADNLSCTWSDAPTWTQNLYRNFARDPIGSARRWWRRP